MRVFVLCTGRTGSATLAAACSYIANFTSAHESRAKIAGPARLDYPDDHIEVDNRLTWFLAPLANRFPDAFYVHLVRDPEAVAQSFLKRWQATPPSMIHAFAHGILMRGDSYGEGEPIIVCRQYVEVVTDTIEAFLKGRSHVTIRLEDAKDDFTRFWDRIGAEGDYHAALAEWQTTHNASAS